MGQVVSNDMLWGFARDTNDLNNITNIIMNYEEYESEFYDHSLDNFNTYEEYLDSHITKEDLSYLGDIELAR